VTNGKTADGAPAWKCQTLRRLTRGASGRPSRGRTGEPHRKYVGDKCERCGFEPEDLCQLEVHHLNGIHRDNRPENLQTLCANCHVLTYRHRGRKRAA
jgi:hypothetical protein